MNATTLPPPTDARDDASPFAPWLETPRLAGRLLWNHWPQLLFWFFAQRVAYNELLGVAIRLAEHTVLLSWAAIALLIVTQLAGTIMMFLSLRPSMPALASGHGVAVQSQPWVTSLSVALLPFFAYYATWGLLDGIKRDFRLAYAFSVAHKEKINDVLALHGLWIAVVVAFAIRLFAKRMAERSKGARLHWTLLAAACDAYWIFVGVAVVGKALGMLKDRWHDTVAWHALAGWWKAPFVFHIDLSAIKPLVEPLWDFAATAASAMLMPLVWLAITAIVYGLDLRRGQRIDRADARFGALGARYQRSHLLVKEVVGRVSGGWNSKGVPVVNAIRLVLRAGLPTLLLLCLGWELLSFLDAWGWRVCVDLIGPRDPAEWWRIGNVLAMLFNGTTSVRPPLFTEVLRVVLLAACFDRAIARLPPPEPAATATD